MKRITTLLLCALVLGIVMPQNAMAQKKKNQKKSDKTYVWELPELTGNKEFDHYLLLCDTLNTEIKKYSEGISFFQMRPIVVMEDGQEIERQWCMVDTTTNTLRSSGEAFKQNMDIILAYPDILLDMTNLTLATTSAGLELTNLSGLKAVSYAKYLKAGPNIIATGGKEMKKIYKLARTQAAQIKDLKAGKVDDDYARNAEIEASDVDAGDASMNVLISSKPIQMDKATYEKQKGEINKKDAENPISDEPIPEEAI